MLARLLNNHVLANLTFALVLIVGAVAYLQLPRQQNPTINFNWIEIITLLPGASAEDVERRITSPLESALHSLADIRFTSSNSRENLSRIVIRFNDISTAVFDKRVADIRRRVMNSVAQMPAGATEPSILEVSSANSFPTITLAVVGAADDENLRLHTRTIERDIERFAGVERVSTIGLDEPELQLNFDPSRMQALGISPTRLADSMALWFHDSSAGTIAVGDQTWLVRLEGRTADPDTVKQFPLVGIKGEIPLHRVAEVTRSRGKSTQDARINGQPAIILAVIKKDDANALQLIDSIKRYTQQRNRLTPVTGVEMVLINDQTVPTLEAINLMQRNALIGLLLVLAICWAFLGFTIAALTAIGIPFILAGTFLSLWLLGSTLNVTVLLGLVIVLGMLVDDAVVVVESTTVQLNRGQAMYPALLSALGEVGAPVFTAVITTMAAFLPLMLLPGVLGDFMRVIPVVVTLALAISLVEAFWMLPAHLLAVRPRWHLRPRWRDRRRTILALIRRRYVILLIRCLRHPLVSLLLVLTLFAGTAGLVALNTLKIDFFASDPLRLFYVSVKMPPQTPLAKTLAKTAEVERQLRRHLDQRDLRAMAVYAGKMYSNNGSFFGDQYGQILVALRPKDGNNRTVSQVLDAIRDDLTGVPGPLSISFVQLWDGPPLARPINIKVRGDDYQQIRAAVGDLKALMSQVAGVINITDDAGDGRLTLNMKPNYDAITQAGLNPLQVMRSARLMVDGEVVADVLHNGERLDVRVRANNPPLTSIDQLLSIRLPTATGQQIPLSELMVFERQLSLANIRRYNFRRAITVEADLLAGELNTLQANQQILSRWNREQRLQHPGIDLDATGELDDIKETLDGIGWLSLLGLGLIYLILGTQFRSYWQPLMILITVPMAFTGVVIGLLLTGYPLSLYSLYGTVALAGIAVNAAIVLIATANRNRQQGFGVLHATVYAARRRVIPILITALTTIGGLFSLATGLGGYSLIWGPVASAIVCGLAFSTLLTLFLVPLLYPLSLSAKRDRRRVS